MIYAKILGYFWLPCPRCGRMFGGHECGKDIIWEEPAKREENGIQISSCEGWACCKFCKKEDKFISNIKDDQILRFGS